MPYEKRVGERIELGDMPVRWSRVRGTPKRKGHPRKRDRRHDVDHTEVYFRDISASGAGMVAPADDSITTGTILAVRVGPEISFVGRVKRITATSDEAWCLYGVEIAEESQGFRDWMHGLLDMRRGGVVSESHWRSSF